METADCHLSAQVGTFFKIKIVYFSSFLFGLLGVFAPVHGWNYFFCLELVVFLIQNFLYIYIRVCGVFLSAFSHGDVIVPVTQAHWAPVVGK